MTRDLLVIMLPTLTVLVGILLNRNDAARLDSRISQMEARLDGRMNTVEVRLGSMDNRIHADFMQVIGKLTELEVRVSKLEVSQ